MFLQCAFTLVIETAERKLGSLKPKRKTWFDEDCKEAAETRRKVRKKWLEDRRNEEKREDFRGARRRASRLNRRKKRQLIESNMREIEEKSKCETAV